MAKAVLVIDMPECCSHCRLEMHVHDKNDYQNWCPFGFIGHGVEGDRYNSRSDWCPLKPFPPKQDSSNLYNGDQVHDSYIKGLDDGYNALVDLLGGEQDG